MARPRERTTSPCPLSIIVIGAGLAGLSTAISCALTGREVLVLEGARELAEIGAGLQITPNGSKVLQYFGLYDTLKPTAAEPTFLQVRRYADGSILSRTDDFHVEMRRKYGAPFWDLHRVDFQRALANRAEELGVSIRLDSKVSDLNFKKSSANLGSGEELSADLLVGGDGLWSKGRERFLAVQGKADSPLPTRDLAYRIVLTVDEVDDSELKEWIANPSCQFWFGPDSHVVA